MSAAIIYWFNSLLAKPPNRNPNMEELMSSNLYDAHRQWCVRPPDERFHDLESLQAFTQRLKDASEVRIFTLTSLAIQA